MKTKTNYGIISAFMLMSVITSCKKEFIEPTPSSPADPLQEQQVVPAAEDEPTSERNTGAVLLPVVEYDKLPKADPGSQVAAWPSSYYLTCPQIRNQGSEASCVAFGCAYAARSITDYYRHNSTYYDDGLNVYSPEFVYNQIKINSSCGSGSYVTSALTLMKTGGGVCRWNTMP